MTVNHRTQPWPFPGEQPSRTTTTLDWVKVKSLASLIDQIIKEGKPADPAQWEEKKRQILRGGAA